MHNSEPLLGASFSQAISRFFRGYARFRGRASRSEFWWIVLFSVLVSILLTGAQFVALMVEGLNTPVDAPTKMIDSPLYAVFAWAQLVVALAVLLPSIAITIRRLHDANFSGWFILLYLTGIGGVVVFIMNLLPSAPAGARFDARSTYPQEAVRSGR